MPYRCNYAVEALKMKDRVGRPLWHAAGAVAPRLAYTAAWSRAGLAELDLEAITSLAGALWRHAGPLWDGMQQVSGACQPEALRAALIGPANEGDMVFAAALDVLLQRTERPSIFITLLKDLPSSAVSVVEAVLNNWIGATLTELEEDDFVTSARLAEEIGTVIAALEALPRITAKTDAKVLAAHRRNLDHFCRTNYREVVSIHVIQAILEMTSEDSETMGEIEAMARVARTLEDTGRRIGSPKPYEELQEEFRAKMERRQQEEAGPGLTAMEVARIEEILIGREAAERFLSRARRQGLRKQ
jgi:hypothetical protein